MKDDYDLIDDEGWPGFVESVRRFWEPYDKKADLIQAVGGDEDIAVAIVYGAGPYALEWLDKEVPALGMRTPRSLLGSEKGRRILRTQLMRVY